MCRSTSSFLCQRSPGSLHSWDAGASDGVSPKPWTGNDEQRQPRQQLILNQTVNEKLCELFFLPAEAPGSLAIVERGLELLKAIYDEKVALRNSDKPPVGHAGL